MTTFIKLNKVSIIANNGIDVEIFKFQKEGTKRVFFTAEINGKRLTKTMFSRLGEVESLTRLFVSKYRMVNGEIKPI